MIRRRSGALGLVLVASVLWPLACATRTPPTRPERLPTPLEIALAPPLPEAPEESEAEPEPAQVAAEWLTIRLGLDERVRFGKLRFRWVAVSDSRCPLGAECVWEGRVSVKLEVSLAWSEPERVELSLSPAGAIQTVLAVGHELQLVSVEPHPRDGEEPSRDRYSARVRYRRLADAMDDGSETPALSGAPRRS